MRVANEAGIAPAVLAWSLDGSLVTELLAGRALRPADGARNISEVAGLLRLLHRSPAFAGLHDPWAMSAELAAVGATDVRCDRLADALEVVRFDPAALTPCHGDPWPGNIVASDHGCKLVDWEYSGMGDPLWDLADFAVECDLDEDDEERLASEYFGRRPDALTVRKIRIYRSLSDLVWARWSLAEHHAGNVADDFESEARRRSEHGLAAVELL
jgi:thiamine kinase-like enzyme